MDRLPLVVIYLRRRGRVIRLHGKTKWGAQLQKLPSPRRLQSALHGPQFLSATGRQSCVLGSVNLATITSREQSPKVS